MPDVQEVYRMSTQEVRQDPGAMDRQHTRQRKAARNRRLGAFAVVGCIGAALIVAVLVASGQRGEPAPSVATQPGGTNLKQTLSIVDVGSGAGTAFTVSLGAGEFDFTLDGSMVTYSDLDENGISQIFVMGADGSNVRQVTHGEADATDPEWSFDGSMIAYVSTIAETSEIFTLRVSDGVSTRVTREPNEVFDPNWAPDGRSIVFATPNPDIGHVVTMSVDLATGQTANDRDGRRSSGVVARWHHDRVRVLLEAGRPTDAREQRRVGAPSPREGAERIIDRWLGVRRMVPRQHTGCLQRVIPPLGDRVGTYVYDVASGERRFVTARMIEGWVDDEHVLVRR